MIRTFNRHRFSLTAFRKRRYSDTGHLKTGIVERRSHSEWEKDGAGT